MTQHTQEIPLAPFYSATMDGKIISTYEWRGKDGNVIKQRKNAYGYPAVQIMIGGKKKSMAVHRLIASAFLPPRPSSNHEIRHRDGNKNNNHAHNLLWGTKKENADDRELHGKTSRGKYHSDFIKQGQENKRLREINAKLLEALEKVLFAQQHLLGQFDEDDLAAVDFAKAAIAAAKGEA